VSGKRSKQIRRQAQHYVNDNMRVVGRQFCDALTAAGFWARLAVAYKLAVGRKLYKDERGNDER
jgi:hypothetical protein